MATTSGKRKARGTRPTRRTEARAPDVPRTVATVLAWLEKTGTQANREGMARYGIVAEKVFGVSVAALRAHAKCLGRSHELAVALWRTGAFEARMLAIFVEEPEHVTPAQMNAWCGAFENWALCDTACLHLFDKTPHALRFIGEWATRDAELEKRAAFALLASVAAHGRVNEATLKRLLPLVERSAGDGRNLVKKGVSWALRTIGHQSRALHAAAVLSAKRLAASDEAPRRFVGKDALRDITRPAVLARIASREKKAAVKRRPR